MRLPFLRPKPEAEPQRAPPPSAARARSAGADGSDPVVDAARTRARRRLVGALVLLAVGVVGFPVLFETRPRPLPLDTPFETAQRAVGEAAAPAPRQISPVKVLPADAGRELAPQASSVPAPGALAESVAAASTPATAPAPAITASAEGAGGAPAPRVAMAPVAVAPRASAAPPAPAAPASARAPATAKALASPVAAAPRSGASAARGDDGARAAALLAGGPASAPAATAPAGPGRYVVQVGAYTDAATLREARAKVEKLGLKTYTQVIENDAGKRTRVRLGPFATRQEADAAAAQVKRTGLPANVLAL